MISIYVERRIVEFFLEEQRRVMIDIEYDDVEGFTLHIEEVDPHAL